MPEDKALLGLVNERAFPQLRTLTVPIGEYGKKYKFRLSIMGDIKELLFSKSAVANVRLLLPPVLREHEELKFPLVVEM